MKLSEFVVPQAIVANLQATESRLRDPRVGRIAGGGRRGQSEVDEVVAALVKREQNGSTGFGKGVAVPHVKHAKVKRMAATIGTARGHRFRFPGPSTGLQRRFASVAAARRGGRRQKKATQQHLQAMNVVFSSLE